VTREEMQELKRLAERAPQTHMTSITLTAESHPEWVAGDAFLRAATPAAVLSLIARIEELEGK